MLDSKIDPNIFHVSSHRDSGASLSFSSRPLFVLDLLSTRMISAENVDENLDLKLGRRTAD